MLGLVGGAPGGETPRVGDGVQSASMSQLGTSAEIKAATPLLQRTALTGAIRPLPDALRIPRSRPRAPETVRDACVGSHKQGKLCCSKRAQGDAPHSLDADALYYRSKARQPTRRGTMDADTCLLYTSPSPRDGLLSRMPSSA